MSQKNKNSKKTEQQKSISVITKNLTTTMQKDLTDTTKQQNLQATQHSPHFPVMLADILHTINTNFNTQKPFTIFDATFGAGGYTNALLNQYEYVKIIACDRDENVLPTAIKLEQKYPNRFFFTHNKFSEIKKIMNKFNLPTIDIILVDLGVSSMQLDMAERGFSFQKAGPLDMGMGLCDKKCIDILSELSEENLANIIFDYGQERHSRKIAKSIKANIKSIKNTLDLANTIHNVMKWDGKKDSATRTFQALRIYINDEMQELRQLLTDGAQSCLSNGGLFAVVTFHSLEDGLVKHFFKFLVSKTIDEFVLNKEFCKMQLNTNFPNFTFCEKKFLTPSALELEQNIRSRSAKLRCIKKI